MNLPEVPGPAVGVSDRLSIIKDRHPDAGSDRNRRDPASKAQPVSGVMRCSQRITDHLPANSGRDHFNHLLDIYSLEPGNIDGSDDPSAVLGSDAGQADAGRNDLSPLNLQCFGYSTQCIDEP